MKKTIPLATLAAVCLLGLAASASAQDLKLVPEPKQVTRGEGHFVLGPKARIVIGAAHAGEDRTAAETLAAEIEAATGRKIEIRTARSTPGRRGDIHLARAPGDRKLRSALEARQLPVDDTLDPEGYVLAADGEGILVAATTGQGLFYGAQTLRQLLRGGAGATYGCPAVRIRDRPAMRWRGIHDDISRGPVPTLDYFKKQIRTCAAYKLNLFSLYIEHVFDYTTHPLIGPKEGALTAGEVKELVEYARRYYVTILPQQQAFGHLHHVLKNEIYNDLAELPHGHVLAPVNEKSYELIRDLYAELIPLFPGPLFHIGADETGELGRGKTKARAEKVGLGRVYLEHLTRVSQILKPYDKRLMFWGDIAMEYPELLGILPKDAIAVAWHYDPDPAFDKRLQPYKDAGLSLFVAPGANNWSRIFPNLGAAFVNIRNFVRDGQKYGALGMLNTTWDDDGESLFGMTWPAVVFGAACAWQEGESSIEEFTAKYDWAFYRNDDTAFRDVIQNLSRTHDLLRGAGLRGAFDDAFWLDPFSELGADYVQGALPVSRELRLAAERALESLYRHRARARSNDDTLDYLIFAAMRLDALGLKVQLAAEISKAYWDAYLHMADERRVERNLDEITGINGRLEDLRDTATRLRAHYAQLWLKESRPYWLGNVLVRYDNLASNFQTKIDAVKVAGLRYEQESVLPTPREMGFLVR